MSVFANQSPMLTRRCLRSACHDCESFKVVTSGRAGIKPRYQAYQQFMDTFFDEEEKKSEEEKLEAATKHRDTLPNSNK